jgi:hypothetical protein
MMVARATLVHRPVSALSIHLREQALSHSLGGVWGCVGASSAIRRRPSRADIHGAQRTLDCSRDLPENLIARCITGFIVGHASTHPRK